MNSSWMPVFFFPFLLFIRSNQWNKKKKKAREGSRSSHDEIFPAGHPFSFQLPLCRAQLLHFSLHVSLRTKIYFGRGICFSEVRFSSALYRVKSLHMYITFRLQNMNNFILRFQFLFRLFTTYLNEIQTKSVIIRLKLCANGHSNDQQCWKLLRPFARS